MGYHHQRGAQRDDLVAAVNLVLASGCPYRMTSNHGGNPVTGLNALPVITTPAIVRGPAILTT
jgi:hypothetical protein